MTSLSAKSVVYHKTKKPFCMSKISFQLLLHIKKEKSQEDQLF